jgi:unsaturated rhamnogalacturonyl hydrolase
MTSIEETIARIAQRTLTLAFDRAKTDDEISKPKGQRWHQWDWSIGVGFYGVGKAYDLNHDDAYIMKLKEWVDSRIDGGIPAICVNTNAPLTTVLRLQQRCPEERYESVCRVFDDYLLNTAPRVPCGALAHETIECRNSGQIWTDTLFMSIVYAVQRSLLLNDGKYLQEALRQLILHVQNLYDASSGLFYHGWNDTEKRPLGARWGRGNAWVIVSAMEILELVPFDFLGKQDLLDQLDHQLATLEQLQDADGYWRTVLDHPETYPESSVTAGVAYGVLKGMRLGLVPRGYGPMAQRAIQALLNNVDGDGNVLRGSSGTPIKQDVAEYAQIPYAITPFTQGLALMALCEFELQS